MSEIQFHRITDWNHSIHGEKKHTHFEAAFCLDHNGVLFLRGRVLDSHEKEIFSIGDVRELFPDSYQSWDPRAELVEFIEAIELQTVEVDPTSFETPLLEMRFEVRGPVAAHPKVFATTISMSSKLSILGQYEWLDSGYVSIFMLCHKDHLLAFAKSLKDDLIDLCRIRETD